jgi:hypothetical protein
MDDNTTQEIITHKEEIPAHIQKRIQEGVRVMNDYKISLVNKLSLLTQNPSALNIINASLRNVSNQTKYYIATLQTPVNSDDEFRIYITNLGNVLKPWNPDVTTQLRYWCEKIFESGSFSRVLNNTKVQEPIMPGAGAGAK